LGIAVAGLAIKESLHKATHTFTHPGTLSLIAAITRLLLIASRWGVIGRLLGRSQIQAEGQG
jgi:hypothetical protein